MEVLGLIPARGGSRGIPRKNLAPLAGKSLIAWTVEAAHGAEKLTRVVVSTDDDEIAGVAEADVLHRPAELAEDETPMIDVVRHAIDELSPDVVVVLQPTSPLRRSEHIDGAVLLLLQTDADCVVSVVEVPHRYGPEALMDLVDGRLVPRGSARTRQEKESVYARNGPAVLALRAERLGGELYDGDCRAYVMDQRSSLDVDTPFDLELAELLLRAR
jgi:CMP-N-acetylneuraminic acid synthetase